MEAPQLPYVNVTPAKVRTGPIDITPIGPSDREERKEDSVEDLQMEGLSVTEKPSGECPTCKKKFKIAGKCLQNHIDKCTDTISEGGTGLK